MSGLNPKKIDFFKGNEWCQECRDWYSSENKECPDCKPIKYTSETRKTLIILCNNKDAELWRLRAALAEIAKRAKRNKYINEIIIGATK